ncbi:MAG: helix-turn-helix domain-containing protein [Fusobacteriaceae bacterium]|nr:helix-turn-helix domain-containing protein [Fusobacteriaceae bacterium]
MRQKTGQEIENRKIIGKNLQLVRIKFDIGLMQMAQIIGRSEKSIISKIEKGLRPVYSEELDHLSNLFEVDFSLSEKDFTEKLEALDLDRIRKKHPILAESKVIWGKTPIGRTHIELERQIKYIEKKMEIYSTKANTLAKKMQLLEEIKTKVVHQLQTL